MVFFVEEIDKIDKTYLIRVEAVNLWAKELKVEASDWNLS